MAPPPKTNAQYEAMARNTMLNWDKLTTEQQQTRVRMMRAYDEKCSTTTLHAMYTEELKRHIAEAKTTR